jgi:hypothetical protein
MTLTKKDVGQVPNLVSKAWQSFICYLAVSDNTYESRVEKKEVLHTKAIELFTVLSNQFIRIDGIPFSWITECHRDEVIDIAQLMKQTSKKEMFFFVGKQIWTKGNTHYKVNIASTEM